MESGWFVIVEGVRYVISSSNHKQHNYVNLNMKRRQETHNGGSIKWKCNLLPTEMSSDQTVGDFHNCSVDGVMLLYSYYR